MSSWYTRPMNTIWTKVHDDETRCAVWACREVTPNLLTVLQEDPHTWERRSSRTVCGHVVGFTWEGRRYSVDEGQYAQCYIQSETHPGTLALIPPDALWRYLRSDYCDVPGATPALHIYTDLTCKQFGVPVKRLRVTVETEGVERTEDAVLFASLKRLVHVDPTLVGLWVASARDPNAAWLVVASILPAFARASLPLDGTWLQRGVAVGRAASAHNLEVELGRVVTDDWVYHQAATRR